MDSTMKKTDISKRILETRKQTEELKAQLQSLIDSGINSSIECKTTSHSHVDKENIKESPNKVQIIKSYDTAHSQHVTKPSSSRLNLFENKKETKSDSREISPKKAKNYDVNKAREYIKKQREKRLKQQRLQNEEKKKAELQKQKLKELHKKSLELVTKNVQAKRERSKSREHLDFIRPVKDIARSRSSSQERDLGGRSRPNSKKNSNNRGKSVEPNKNIPLENLEHINPNLLYPPIPNYVLRSKEQNIKKSNKNSSTSHNKITIISGNSTGNSGKKIESPKSDAENGIKLLKPRNLFNTPKSNLEISKSIQIEEKKIHTSLHDSPIKAEANSIKVEEKISISNNNSSEKSSIKIISGNSSDKKNQSPKAESNVPVQKLLNPPNILELSHIIDGKASLEIKSKNFKCVSNILEYKNIQNKQDSKVTLQSPVNTNLENKKISEVAIGTDNLEKFAKETQTNSEQKQEFPTWLQEKRFESDPLNFINTVRRKLQNAVNSPKMTVDVGVQSSFAQQNFGPHTSHIKGKDGIMEILQHSAKSSKKSDLKSFMSHKFLNLNQKTIDNIELIPKKFSDRTQTIVKTSDTESESDTSKNIPEISSESGTSLKRNAESVKQNGNVGLDIERLSSMRLRAHNVNNNTHTILSEKGQTESTSNNFLSMINNKPDINSNEINLKIETKKSDSRTLITNNQYTSDFQSGSRSIITDNGATQNRTASNSINKKFNYDILTEPKLKLNSEKHSSNIPETTERHSKVTIQDISANSESEQNFQDSFKNITIRSSSLQNSELKGNGVKDNIKNMNGNSIHSTQIPSSIIPTETDSESSKNQYEGSHKNESEHSVRSSYKSDKYISLCSDIRPSAAVSEILSKSDSNLQYINTKRGSQISSKSSTFLDIPPLKESSLSLAITNEKVKGKSGNKDGNTKLTKNISLRSDTNKFADLNNTNEIHLKFEAEIHLLNDFNESLRQFSEVEKAFNSLKSKNDNGVTTNKILQNQDTQTSVATKSSTTSKISENSISDGKNEFSTINYSRGFFANADSSSLILDNTISKLDDSNSEGVSAVKDVLNLDINPELSNFENLHSHNFAGMTLRMFEQLIKDEDVRLDNLKTILKIREQALLDRTKGELAWLEIQRKHLRETGKLQEASLIKKKQRGILVNHQKERHEMQRLKQMQKAASLERKIILKEQRNLIKHQLSTDKMLSKIKVNTPRERRTSGPLKVIQSHTESIKSETSFSRKSSSDREKEVYSIMSHTQSIVSRVSEVSGDEVMLKDGTSRADSTDLVTKFASEACGVPVSQMKRTLLMREAALQKRRKAAEELLQWHRKLLEEEKRITELESTANTIISQIPNNAPASPDVTEKYQFKGKQLNQLWFNLTGCKEKKFSENKIYPMSQIALERFCKSAREYSIKTKKILKRVSDSEVCEYSEARTDDSISENIPDQKVNNSASIRTETEHSGQSSHRNDSVTVTTANDYTSDFDIESIQEIVNIESMEIVDKSINQLIDNFNKIQDDISSLSIKQSLKSGIDLEPEESIRSEKTESDVEVSVIETAKTSIGKTIEGVQLILKENNKISSPNKTLSTSQDIKDLSIDITESAEICVASKEGTTEVSSYEVSSEEQNSLKDSKEAKSERDPSEDRISGERRDNLNKSEEIIEELSNLQNLIIKDRPFNEESTLEEIQIGNEETNNITKSEEILSRLTQLDEIPSIIASTDSFNKDPFQSETRASLQKIDIHESEGILLNLQVDKSCADVSSTSKLSVEDVNQLPSQYISSEIQASYSSSRDTPLNNKSDVNEGMLVEDILKFNEPIDLNSEVISETSLEMGKFVATNDILLRGSREPTLNSAIDEVSIISEVVSPIIEDNLLISDELKNQDLVQIHDYKEADATSKNKSMSLLMSDLPHIKQGGSEEVADLSREDTDVPSISLEKDKETHSVPTEEISENILEGYKETDIDERSSVNDESRTEVQDREPYSVIDTSSSIIKNTENCIETEEAKEINEDFSSTDQNEELIIVSEHSRKDVEEYSESKPSESVAYEKNSLEKSPTIESSNSESYLSEKKIEEDISQKSTSIVPSAIDETEKSQVISENLATLLSKEDINSYEEKELDSMSPSTAESQSSTLNEKGENLSEKSKSSVSGEKSPRNGAVDVKKRVSEIMADASQVSRGDKSPKLQDFYTTTYDLVSPTNSPELGSPTEEHKFITAKSIYGTEAEEILRKQLAIEQEIKQITEQQQKEQLPYLFVREIPNKPPPPYTPPSSLTVTSVVTIIPTSEEIEDITKYSAKILHKAYLSNTLDTISISENTLSLISKDITKECYKFIFDLCKEISKEHYKQFEKEKCVAWLQVRKNSQLAIVKPLDVIGLEKHMNKKLKELFGYEKPMRRENAIIKWSRKKRDHVDEILVMESQTEEAQWTNYDKDELLVMNEVTNEIMNMLLKETGEVFSKILSKPTF